MWCGKCGVSQPQNEPCKYPDVSKSWWWSTCGGRQNDHIKGCPVQKRSSILQVCKRCEGEGHTQENCTATRVPCYKCGEMEHLAETQVMKMRRMMVKTSQKWILRIVPHQLPQIVIQMSD